MVLKGIVLKRRFFFVLFVIEDSCIKVNEPKGELHAVKGNACHWKKFDEHFLITNAIPGCCRQYIIA